MSASLACVEIERDALIFAQEIKCRFPGLKNAATFFIHGFSQHLQVHAQIAQYQLEDGTGMNHGA